MTSQRATLGVRCLRHEVLLECGDERVRERARTLLGSWVVDEVGASALTASIVVEQTSAGPWFHLTVGAVTEYVGPGLEGCLDSVVWRLTQDGVAADDRILVHAACVADERDRAALLVGPSGSGKTTLSVALARQGYRLLSDEVGVVDRDDLRVWPFARPPGFEPDAAFLFPDLSLGEPGGWSRHVPLAAIARQTAVESPAAIGVIVVPTYDKGASTCELVELAEAETLLALARSTPRLGDLGQEALDGLKSLAIRVPGYRLRCGPLEQAAAAVRDVLERSARQPRAPRSSDIEQPTVTRKRRDAGAKRHTARSISVSVGEAAVVNLGDTTTLLNSTAALCWWSLARWSTVDDVVGDVAARVGLAPDAIADDIAALIADLDSAALLDSLPNDLADAPA